MRRRLGGMARQIADEKQALRADIRTRRQSLSESQRDQATAALAERLDELIERTGARTVSCYLSSPAEPGTRAFINDAMARGVRVLLPVTRADGLLDWTVATPDGGEYEGLFGLSEPEGELLGPMAVDDADLMIVPAAAVGSDGTRLGWGRGYFDKTLGSMQKCPPVYAVVYDNEVLDAVPREPHDQPVDGIVTPTTIIALTSSAR